jgi:MerR family transcriptional regulator, light-induced transcriptional regulator
MLRRDSNGSTQSTDRAESERGGRSQPARRNGAWSDGRHADGRHADGRVAQAHVGANALLDSAACQQSMATLIADEIIPRLIAAHRGLATVDAVHGAILLDSARLADLAVSADAGHLADIAELALAGGLSFESLLIDVMAPAARILGERWEDDTADFIEVTLGLWRLQELVHELASRRCGPESPYIMHERRILCAVAPDDDHSFGSLMLEELFRRAGWTCTGLRGASRAKLLRQVSEGWFEIIALTVSVERNSDTLSRLVADIRAASCNPGVSIMVGGPVFNEDASLADEIGADATASTARAALQKAELLVGHYLVGSDRSANGHSMPHGVAAHPAARAGIQPG